MVALDIPALLAGRDIRLAETPQLVLRRLDRGDFECLRHFRAEIVAAIGDPDILRLMPEEEAYVADSLNAKNLAMGLFKRDRLVAYNSLFWPETDDDLRNLYIYDEARPRAAPREIAYAGGLMVDPLARGAGLQKLLIEVRQVTTYHVRRRHHFSTVSFANHFSWRNILEMGGRVVAVYEFEDPRYGHTRRMLTHQAPTPKALAPKEIWLAPLDIEAQRDLLVSGHVGTKFRLGSSGAEIAYQREID